MLRVFFAAFVMAVLAWDLSMVWDPPKEDPLLASDWWLTPVIFAMIGGGYLYASSTLRITATHVELYNPFRRVAIPGANLRIETASTPQA